jgi:hypothetical protein
MAPTLENLVQAVAEFQTTHRHPERPLLALSGLYDLDPVAPAGPAAAAVWPATWLHNAEPGVYAILAGDLTVRYIGKADVLGDRLSSHFRNGERPRVVDAERWPEPYRRYVVVVPVGQAFESLSLEAYLIRHLAPPDNAAGKGPRT